MNKPVSLSHSEGKTYDILNYKIFDAERLKNGPMHDDIRAFNRMKRDPMESSFQLTGDISAQQAEEKSLKRISYKRWERTHDRGYDMVNNTLYNSESQHKPSSLRSLSEWKQLEPSASNQTMNTTISANNFLGSHTGTGLMRRAYTSYPSNREGEVFRDLSGSSSSARHNSNPDPIPKIGSSSSSHREVDGMTSLARAKSKEIDFNNYNHNKEVNKKSEVFEMKKTIPVEKMTILLSNRAMAAAATATSLGPSLGGKISLPSQRARPESIPLLPIGREAPMMSVRTGGLSAI